MKTNKEIQRVFTECKVILMKYGLDVDNSIYKQSFQVFTNLYEHYQSFRSHPDKKIRNMAKKAFSEAQKWGKEFYLIVAINNVSVDIKRLKSFVKRNKELIVNLELCKQ